MVNTRKKAMRTGILFIVLFLLGGVILMYKGNDAIALATERKEGILTADQVKMAFDSVKGRLVRVNVREGDTVKAGDVVMQLDTTDTDIAIAKTKAQIAQLDAQIQAKDGSMSISYQKADSDETQSFRQIDQQRAAVTSAEATLANSQLDFNRKSALFADGAIARSQLDDAQTALSVAQANVAQQRQALERLLAGAQDSGDTNTIQLPTIAQERQTAANMVNEIESLRQQKASLESDLQQLQVNRERLTLRAPEDGKVLKVLAKEGEMVNPSEPVVLLESNRAYYDIYISEDQARGLAEGDTIVGTTVSGKKKVTGTIRLLTKAPGFADLKQSREKGQADLSAFQVRIDVEPQDGVATGMTIGVNDSEFHH